jgi:hypothetical protein
MSLIKKWHAKNFDAMCDFLFAHKQEIAFHRIAPKMLTSCPCNGGLANQIAAPMQCAMLHTRLRMTIRFRKFFGHLGCFTPTWTIMFSSSVGSHDSDFYLLHWFLKVNMAQPNYIARLMHHPVLGFHI